ncbi:MAG TPA: hypothetical protein ENH85_15205 [Candidatus Scalindua sp.]|nr:hypothetical protein [Candidatus Scalindua sp.]
MTDAKRVEKIRKIRELYDSFGPDGKDMTWPDFLREFTGLTSPSQMQNDLAGIMSQKQLGRSTKARINEAISRNNSGICLN